MENRDLSTLLFSRRKGKWTKVDVRYAYFNTLILKPFKFIISVAKFSLLFAPLLFSLWGAFNYHEIIQTIFKEYLPFLPLSVFLWFIIFLFNYSFWKGVFVNSDSFLPLHGSKSIIDSYWRNLRREEKFFDLMTDTIEAQEHRKILEEFIE